MFYILLKEIAKKFPSKLAVNNLTYSDLIRVSEDREYNAISNNTGLDILLDLLKAMSLDKPIVVLPKDKDNIKLPERIPDKFALILYSSGSTGLRTPKLIPESMLMANLNNFISTHKLTEDDKVLTVCSLNHTAGLTCQTLSALLAGASINIETFNPFNMVKFLDQYQSTVTHVVPLMTKSLMKLGPLKELPQLRFVCMGSDCITKDQIEYWQNDNRKIMTVYGQTEAGPPVIHHIFNYNDDLSIFDYGYPVGTQLSCDYRFSNNELLIKGDICHSSDWHRTGDCFDIKHGWFFYTGRVSANGKIIPKGY